MSTPEYERWQNLTTCAPGDFRTEPAQAVTR